MDCYECHSNRPGCGAKVDWILMRWKRCVAPGGSKCVKIIERSPDGSYSFETKKETFTIRGFFLGEINYVRGCINQIEAVRPEMPTVRENGCWTATDQYVVRIFQIISADKILIFPGFSLSTVVCRSRWTDLLFL